MSNGDSLIPSLPFIRDPFQLGVLEGIIEGILTKYQLSSQEREQQFREALGLRQAGLQEAELAQRGQLSLLELLQRGQQFQQEMARRAYEFENIPATTQAEMAQRLFEFLNVPASQQAEMEFQKPLRDMEIAAKAQEMWERAQAFPLEQVGRLQRLQLSAEEIKSAKWDNLLKQYLNTFTVGGVPLSIAPQVMDVALKDQEVRAMAIKNIASLLDYKQSLDLYRMGYHTDTASLELQRRKIENEARALENLLLPYHRNYAESLYLGFQAGPGGARGAFSRVSPLSLQQHVNRTINDTTNLSVRNVNTQFLTAFQNPDAYANGAIQTIGNAIGFANSYLNDPNFVSQKATEAAQKIYNAINSFNKDYFKGLPDKMKTIKMSELNNLLGRISSGNVSAQERAQIEARIKQLRDDITRLNQLRPEDISIEYIKSLKNAIIQVAQRASAQAGAQAPGFPQGMAGGFFQRTSPSPPFRMFADENISIYPRETLRTLAPPPPPAPAKKPTVPKKSVPKKPFGKGEKK